MRMANDNLQQVLEGYEQERIQLGVKFLNQALVASTVNDNHECIGKLIKMGATNIDECIQLAKEKKVTHALAMLWLMKAALSGDEGFLRRLINPSLSANTFHEMSHDSEVSLLSQVVRTVQNDGRLSTMDALEVAQRSGQHSVHRKLMMLTHVNMGAGSVDWSNLSLVHIDARLLEACKWLTDLDLSANKLHSIPSEIDMLNRMTNANLSDNNLTTIPASLLQLPKLKKLSLSHNKISHLPDTPHWSANLSVIDLSNNRLSSLPMNCSASALVSLNISKNRFNSVPLCVCTFTTLTCLDLSDNPNIRSLPCELGMLTRLEEMNLNGLKKLKEPPTSFTRSPQKCIPYLRGKLSDYDDSSHCIQLMVVGNPGSGKHALVSMLQNRELSSHQCNFQIHVSEWAYRPNITKRTIHFRIWMFNSLEDYKLFTHKCFLLQRSLYLLLFNVKRESKGVQDVKTWLESITYQAPYSSVVITGTHTDEMTHQAYCNGDFLLQQAKMVASIYENKVEVIGFLQLGLKHHQDALSQLLDNIYSYAVSYPLFQLEKAIIQEIGIGGERLEDLLNSSEGTLSKHFLNYALEFATQMDSDVHVGQVALACPENIQQCIKLAKTEGKHRAHAMLLLITAARSGDKEILNHLLLEPHHEAYCNRPSSHVYCRQFSVYIPINVPIMIAQQSDQIQVMNELLMNTEVCQVEGYVHWKGLQLHELSISLLRKIFWVKTLILSRNKLTTLPQEMSEYLKQVVKIDLQCNDITTVPGCLFEIPSLAELYLAHNKLKQLPEITKWSPSLTLLDLSNNQLSSLPSKVVAPAIRSLNVSRNKFHSVPLCICSFTTLQSLDLSDNLNIVVLPAQMGRLDSLSHLNLSGLKNLKDPPKYLQKKCHECICYLNSKLRNTRECYRMKMMLLGNTNQGKTTLVARLQGKAYLPIQDMTISSGLDVSQWWYRPSIGRRAFYFNIWDFSSEIEYSTICRCFLTQCTLYLLLFNLEYGDKGIGDLRPWLDSIALQAPHSRVIIVGTHLDKIPDKEREQIDTLLHRVGALASSYNNTIQIVEVLPVGLKNHIENIGLLKEAIYNHAASYMNQNGQLIMGQKIPASYLALYNKLEALQLDVKQGIGKPVMHTEEFKAMVHQMNLDDILNHEELRTATSFLTDIGSILHFDDRGHNLHKLYFIDPCWLHNLYSMMYRTIATSHFVENGILYAKDISMVFKYVHRQFPWKYFEQFLTLLDRFELALPLDNQRVMLPLMLPTEKPKELEDDNQDPVYTRIIMFSSTSTPPGFWSRLLSMIMYSVPQVHYVLDKSAPNSYPATYSITPNYYYNEVEINQATEAGRAFQTSLNMSTVPSSLILNTPKSAAIYAAHTHSDSLLSSINTPHLLPNIPKPLPVSHNISNLFNSHLEYWSTGLHYKDEDVTFRIECLQDSKRIKSEATEGVIVIASGNISGKKIFGQLVNLVVSLVGEWYPSLKYGSSSLQQKVPCFECVKQGRAEPYEFKMEECLSMITKNETVIKCGYFRDEPAKNHIASLTDIVPDLLLQDINSKFILNVKEVNYNEDNASLLGKGGCGKVYRGKYNGKSVAIKKCYCLHDVEAIIKLQKEIKILHQLCHPCIVDFIGVCIQPLHRLIVLEEAPLGSLEFPLLKKMIPVHRVTIFRIAIEVAAGLRYMHNQGIIKGEVMASNVLMWTFDPDSLCHCKLGGFALSVPRSPIGARGLHGTKGFIAPEVLYTGLRQQHSIYDHRADIFSLGMLFYQMIARRDPYHNIPNHRIEAAVLSGERPTLHDISNSHTCFHHLTQIMAASWEDNPDNRPDTDTIINKLCQPVIQMVMCVKTIGTKLLLGKAIAITPSHFAKAGYPNQLQSELWLCCNNEKNTEVHIFNIHTMLEIDHIILKNNQVQFMALCGGNVLLGSKSALKHGVIDIFSADCKELTYNGHVHEDQTVSCITATDKAIYMGTLEGYCFSYNHINEIQAKIKPRCKHISENPIDGILCTETHVWTAQTKYIHILNPNDLSLESFLHRKKGQPDHIGQLSLDPDRNIVWSAHLGGVMLSAWNIHNKCHIYDIDTGRHLEKIADAINDADNILTAMTPSLDTVWVGMATGHIMVFHEEEFLLWFHPYRGYVRFLTYIPSAGPCEMEKAMVASGGKQFQPLLKGLDKSGNKLLSISDSETLIMWEAFEKKTIKQMKLIEQNALNHLENHNNVHQMIREGGFQDGTCIVLDSIEVYKPTSTETPPLEHSIKDKCLNTLSPKESLVETLTLSSKEETEDKTSNPIVPEFKPSHHASQSAMSKEEIFNIKPPDSEQAILVRCSKPVTLQSLNNKVQVSVAQGDYLVYYRDEEVYELQTQENLDEYLRMPDKPQLCINSETHAPKVHHATDKSSDEEINISIMGVTEQNLMLTCPKPAQVDTLLNEITSFGSLKDQKFNLVYPACHSEIKVITQEDFNKYLAISNRPPLLVKLEQNTSFPISEDIGLTYTGYTVSSSSNALMSQSKVAIETTDDVTLHFKLFDSEHTLDVVCTKPLRLEAVLNDIKLIANLGVQEWQLVYSVDDSYIKIENQEDFDEYLSMNNTSMLTLWISSMDI